MAGFKPLTANKHFAQATKFGSSCTGAETIFLAQVQVPGKTANFLGNENSKMWLKQKLVVETLDGPKILCFNFSGVLGGPWDLLKQTIFEDNSRKHWKKSSRKKLKGLTSQVGMFMCRQGKPSVLQHSVKIGSSLGGLKNVAWLKRLATIKN